MSESQVNQSEEATMNEVLETINTFANNVYQKFADIDKRFDDLEKRVTHIEMTMVTKEYLDDKLADQRSEVRVFNNKLINTLEAKNVFNKHEVRELRQFA